MQNKIESITEAQVARAFSKVLRNWLTPEEMTQVIAANKAERNPNICHTHDYCDANMAMCAAFEKVLGATEDEVCELVCSGSETVGGTRATQIWSAAWRIAAANEYAVE